MARLINKADQGELLKPWHRVHFNKDGSVQSCERVDGAKNERGGYIQYVQADSKEEAIVLARERVTKYEEWRSRYRDLGRAREQRLRESGLCVKCGKRPLATKNECRACADRALARQSKVTAGEIARKPIARTDAEKVAALGRIEESRKAERRSRNARIIERLGSVHAYTSAVVELRFARRCLEVHDRTTGGQNTPFRKWLIREIRDLEVRRAAGRIDGQPAAAAE